MNSVLKFTITNILTSHCGRITLFHVSLRTSTQTTHVSRDSLAPLATYISVVFDMSKFSAEVPCGFHSAKK